MSEISSLIKSKNTEKILEFIKEEQNKSQIKKKLNWLLHYFFENKLEQYIPKLYDIAGVNPRNVKKCDDGALAIRYLVETDIESAIELYISLIAPAETRKALLFLIVKKFIEDDDFEFALNFYLKYISNYTISEEDLYIFMKLPKKYIIPILELCINMSIIVDSNLVENLAEPSKKLRVVGINDTEKINLINLLKEKVGNFEIPSFEKRTYVIDGANILFSTIRQGKVNYNLLDSIINNIYKEYQVVLVLHKRHKNPTFFEKWDEKICILRTPYKKNDDWYSILTAIKNDAYLITNDNFRDHIFESKKFPNSLKYWCDDFIVKFSLDGLEAPKLFSKRVQKIDDEFYIPTNTNKWMKV